MFRGKGLLRDVTETTAMTSSESVSMIMTNILVFL